MYITEYIDFLNNKIKEGETKYSYLTESLSKLKMGKDDVLEGYSDHFYSANSGVYSMTEESITGKEIANIKVEFKDARAKNIIEVEKEIAIVLKEINKLRQEREILIANVLTFANLSVKDALWILERFHLYYKPVSLIHKTLLVPQDLSIMPSTIDGSILDWLESIEAAYQIDFKVIPLYRKNHDNLMGANRLIRKYALKREIPIDEIEETPNFEENLKAKLETLILKLLGKEELKPVKEVPKYDLRNMDTIIKTEEGYRLNPEVLKVIPLPILKEVMEEVKANPKELQEEAETISYNNLITKFVPSLEVNDAIGIMFYKRKDNSIVFNSEVLNIFPYEAIGFIEYYIQEKCANVDLTIKEAWNNYNLNKGRN